MNEKTDLLAWLRRKEYDSLIHACLVHWDEWLQPAICPHDCMVKPDGYCEHGHPSLMVLAGLKGRRDETTVAVPARTSASGRNVPQRNA